MKLVLSLIAGLLVGIGAARLMDDGAVEVEPMEDDSTPEVAAPLPDLPEPFYQVLFENDEIRVVEHRLGVGEEEPEHTHPPMTAYFVSGATLAMTEADGSTEEMTVPTGAFLEQPMWWTHSMVNTGETPLHSILIEFKGREEAGSS